MKHKIQFVVCLVLVFGLAITAVSNRARAETTSTWCNQYGDSTVCNTYSNSAYDGYDKQQQGTTYYNNPNVSRGLDNNGQ